MAGEISVKKSSRSVSRVLFSVPKRRVSVIYLRSLSPVSSSGLPSDVGRATLVNAGLHDLTTPKMHSPHIAIRLVGSYPTFSPLPPGGGGYFLLHYSAFAGGFLLGSRMLCVARTFLFYLYIVSATDRPAAFSVQRYANKRNLCYNWRDSFVWALLNVIWQAGRFVSGVTISLVMNVNLADLAVNCG